MGERREKLTALKFVLTLSVLFVVSQGDPSAIFCGKWTDSLYHHFFHASILHLVVNCYAIFVLYGRKFTLGEFVLAYAIATLSYFVAIKPAVGYSNILYATMGLRSPSLTSSWWRSPSTIIFLCVTVAYLFVPSVSATTHLASFAGGVAVAIAGRFLKSNKSDYGKARGSRG